MTIKYRELMKEYDLKIDDPVLDPAFVSKANEFEQKVANNELTDDEMKVLDDELVELFNTKHDFAEEDSEETKNLKHQKDVADAKAEIAEADTKGALTGLQVKFKDLPEVLPLIIKKLDVITKKEQKADDEKTAKFLINAKKEIAAAKYEDLQAMGEKYSEYPELVAIIKQRHADEKPENKDNELATKLRTKKEWSYNELKALGISPTGNDMTVAGVRLEKEMFFTVYSVRK